MAIVITTRSQENAKTSHVAFAATTAAAADVVTDVTAAVRLLTWRCWMHNQEMKSLCSFKEICNSNKIYTYIHLSIYIYKKPIHLRGSFSNIHKNKIFQLYRNFTEFKFSIKNLQFFSTFSKIFDSFRNF